MQTLFPGLRNRNRLACVRKQIGVIEDHIAQREQGSLRLVPSPSEWVPRCRTCHAAGCDGHCWGTWKRSSELTDIDGPSWNTRPVARADGGAVAARGNSSTTPQGSSSSSSSSTGRSSSPKSGAAAEDLEPGTAVVRGRDWKWGRQDGGDGKRGIVVEPVAGGRVRVRWEEKGYTNVYRYGVNGKYDVETQELPAAA